jgi:hypothetical protein
MTDSGGAAPGSSRSGLSWAEIDRLMGEDPDDRAIREAHGFGYDDDFKDRSLLCRNGCGETYYDIAVRKRRECPSAPLPAGVEPPPGSPVEDIREERA